MKKWILLLIAIGSFLSTQAQYNRHSSTGKHIAVDSLKYNEGSRSASPEMHFLISGGYGYLFLGQYMQFTNPNATVSPKVLGPIYFKAAIQPNTKSSIGVSVAYATAYRNEVYRPRNSSTPITTTHRFTALSVLLRYNQHLRGTEKLDPYFGFGVGWGNRWNTYNPSVNVHPGRGSNMNPLNGINIPFGAEITLGAAYYFLPHFAVYGEAGIAKSPIQVGLCYKL